MLNKYILSGKPGKIPANLGNVSDMLAYYYQTNGEWKDDKTVYTFGEEVKHKQYTQATATSNFKLQTFNSNQWREMIKMRAAAPSIWNTQFAETKKDYGVMVHTALSKIKTNDDVVSALNTMCAEGLINIEEKENLQNVLSKIISLPQLQPHFVAGLIVKNESEIVSITGEFYRLDRVVLNDKNAVVIDYKTGEEKPAHKKQILQYADLLAQMGYIVLP
jgi:ATP-dependent exoDNAse (exonuclease V) beta subunit